jgi:hypothetical protein
VVSFTLLPLCPRRNSPFTHWIGGWVSPRTDLDNMEKRKISHLPVHELRPVGRPARSQSLHRLRYYIKQKRKATWNLFHMIDSSCSQCIQNKINLYCSTNVTNSPSSVQCILVKLAVCTRNTTGRATQYHECTSA